MAFYITPNTFTQPTQAYSAILRNKIKPEKRKHRVENEIQKENIFKNLKRSPTTANQDRSRGKDYDKENDPVSLHEEITQCQPKELQRNVDINCENQIDVAPQYPQYISFNEEKCILWGNY